MPKARRCCKSCCCSDQEFCPPRRSGLTLSAVKMLTLGVAKGLSFLHNLTLLKEALSDPTKEEHDRDSELAKVQETLFSVLVITASRPAVPPPSATPHEKITRLTPH